MEPIERRPCTAEELGLGPLGFEDPSSLFWPISDASRYWLELDWKKLYCVGEQLDLHGDYNSGIVTHFGVHLERCNPDVRPDCKPDDEITQWLKRKFIITITNNERFNPNDYSDDKVVQESVLIWHPVRS